MFWFIPTTHRVVIAALLAIAVIAFVLFWLSLVVARRRRRAEFEPIALAAIRRGVRTPNPPAWVSQGGPPEGTGQAGPGAPPPAAPRDE